MVAHRWQPCEEGARASERKAGKGTKGGLEGETAEEKVRYS